MLAHYEIQDRERPHTRPGPDMLHTELFRVQNIHRLGNPEISFHKPKGSRVLPTFTDHPGSKLAEEPLIAPRLHAGHGAIHGQVAGGTVQYKGEQVPLRGGLVWPPGSPVDKQRQHHWELHEVGVGRAGQGFEDLLLLPIVAIGHKLVHKLRILLGTQRQHLSHCDIHALHQVRVHHHGAIRIVGSGPLGSIRSNPALRRLLPLFQRAKNQA
mmetsp:Transcript_99528/g.228448  ORF Transcript_99528/g.228448 Transcript_99528/m.228448 type:complete len:212 (+) Transcript_99528:931-1566(+)